VTNGTEYLSKIESSNRAKEVNIKNNIISNG